MIRIATTLLLLSTTACLTGEFTDEPEGIDDDAAALGGSVAIRVVQHNVEKRLEVIQSSIKKATSSGAEAITLQEVCPDQLAWLNATYGAQWTIGSIAGKKKAVSGCDLPNNDHDVPTDVVIYLGKGGTVKPLPVLAAPAAAPGQGVCVAFQRGKVDVHVCSVHLISSDWVDGDGVKHDGEEIRGRQTGTLRDVTDAWIKKGDFVIVGGDFNGKPYTAPLDKMYDARLGGGKGSFTEYNRKGSGRDGQITATASGSNTEDGQPFSRKIDYLFFSTNRAPLDGPDVDVVDDASDHNMVTSTVQMKKKI